MMELFTYTIFSLVFNSSYKLEGPSDAGINAKSFVYSENTNELFYINFVLFSQESINNMAMSDEELLNYFKTTFMGSSKPAEKKVDRTVLNQISEGEIIYTKIPVNAQIEAHLINLENGEKLGIGFKINNQMSSNVREDVIIEILTSLNKRY